MQLRGPVPAPMYHRYVEFKPFVEQMFTAKGVRGFILSKALHHQHARVYNFDQSTAYQHFASPCKDFTQKFLELVHWDQGGRIFTYVLTLDALFRFTETGKEFGIDMLSKHTMHSDVAPYVAFSGEFFIRRWDGKHEGEKGEKEEQQHHHPHGNEEHGEHDDTGANANPSEADGPVDNSKKQKHCRTRSSKSGKSGHSSTEPVSPNLESSSHSPEKLQDTSPHHYELVIDNDSGTYRPNPSLLPLLHDFLSANFPGLHIRTLDCQAQAEEMAALKKAQRERKQKEGQRIVFTQLGRGSMSSLSSSDASVLDRMEEAAGLGGDGSEEKGKKGDGDGREGVVGVGGSAGGMSALEEQTHMRHRVRREAEERAQAAKMHVKEYKPRGVKDGWKGAGKGGEEAAGDADVKEGEESGKQDEPEEKREQPPESRASTTAQDPSTRS